MTRAPGPIGLLIISLMLAAASLILANRALADGELARAREARVKFMDSLTSQKRSDWLNLIHKFEEAAQAQVKAEPAAKANFLAAELSYMAFEKYRQPADLTRAGQLSRKVIKCSRCPDAPAALIILGRMLIADKKADEAYRELMKVELNYPLSAEVATARKLMASLRSGGSQPPSPVSPDSGSKPASPAPTPVITSPAQEKPQIKTPPNPKAAPVVAKIFRPHPTAPAPRGDNRPQLFGLFLDEQQNFSTVTAYLDKVTPYIYNMLPPSRNSGTFRVYVDFKNTKLLDSVPGRLKNSTPLVKLVKINQLNQDTVRLVADLPQAYPYMPLFLDNPPRLIINIAKEPGSLPLNIPEAQPDPPPPPPEPKKPAPEKPPRASSGPSDSMARQLGLKIKTVIIDAGHGGKDGGAVGNNIQEKELVLKTAKLLASKIEKRLNLKVIMTRDSDKFVTLDRRTRIARESKGDLFISIHANSNDLAKVEGYETYILNFATDKSAMNVAARENAGANKSMAEMTEILTQIAKNTKVAESRVMARAIHNGSLSAIRQKYKVRDLGVKEAPFVVLVNTNVPAALVEIGFVTNSQEAIRLKDDAYIELITDGLTRGLKSYIDGLPK